MDRTNSFSLMERRRSSFRRFSGLAVMRAMEGDEEADEAFELAVDARRVGSLTPDTSDSISSAQLSHIVQPCACIVCCALYALCVCCVPKL